MHRMTSYALPGRYKACLRAWLQDWGGRLTLSIGAYLLLLFLWLAAPWGTPAQKSLVTNLSYIPIELVIAVLCWRIVKHSAFNRQIRRAWQFFSVAYILYCVYNGIWVYYENLQGVSPSGTWLDLLFLGYFPLMLLGILSFPATPQSRSERITFYLDAGTVLLGTGMLIWHFVLRPIAVTEQSTLIHTLLAMAYPIGDILLLVGIITILLRRQAPSSQDVPGFLAIGLFIKVMGDLGYNYLLLENAYYGGMWPDIAWLTSDFLLVISAHLYYLHTAEPSVATAPASGSARRMSWLPYLGILLGYGMVASTGIDELMDANNPHGTFLTVGTILIVLVVLRHLLTVRENAHLLVEQATLASELRLQTMLHASEERYRMLAEHATDIIAFHHPDGTIRYCSPACTHLLGHTPEAIISYSITELVYPDDRPLLALAHQQSLSQLEPVSVEYRVQHKQGHYVWLETSGRAVRDPVTNAVCEVITVSHDITARKARETEIETLAFYDPLTKLANRRHLHQSAYHALSTAQMHHTAVSLLYLDLDRFKLVNDTLGHAAGDELLVEVAARLQAHLRTEDTLARLGGDEFALLLPGLGVPQARTIAEHILSQIDQPFTVRGHPIHLGASIGIAAYPCDGTSFEDLLKHADIAMYRAKSERGCYRVHDPTLTTYSQESLLIEAELRQAIATHQLVLHYQPILDLPTNRIIGAEALVRWQHPQRGLLAPGLFIPLAEESGLIRALDRWVVQMTLRQVAAWAQAGQVLHVALNLSMRSLHDVDLVNYVATCLHATGASPASITVEITESAAMHHLATTRQVLAGLKSLGISIALDDFGAGQTSLTCLKHLPVDVVKIDQSFVRGIGHNLKDEGVIRALLVLSQELHMALVAEGVENTHQRTWLASAGCALVQGYAVGYPMPPTALFQLLTPQPDA